MSDLLTVGFVRDISTDSQLPALHVVNTSTATRAAKKALDDQVTLSQTAQAELLYEIGRTPREIADELGVSVTTIEADLRIASTISLTKFVAAAHG